MVLSVYLVHQQRKRPTYSIHINCHHDYETSEFEHMKKGQRITPLTFFPDLNLAAFGNDIRLLGITDQCAICR